ncbi:MAG: LysM peptidoglycan-binding domain-containing protein [Acidimicrobiales bacterium]
MCLLVFDVAALVALRWLGASPRLTVDWSDPGGWLAATPAEDAVVAVVRLIALGVAYWLIATTVLYLLARLAGLPSMIRGVQWATLPTVRRLIDGVTATSLVAASTVSGSALVMAQESPRAPVAETHAYTPVPANDGEPSYTPVPAGDGQPTTTTTAVVPEQPPPSEAPTVAPADAAPATHVVVAGDNLWTIAEQHLAHVTGRRTDEMRPTEVHAYWLRVIGANRERLVSGDPNLIYPGEALTLPPVAVS